MFRTGESAVVEDIGDAPDYLPTIPGVRAEVCFPLRVGDQIVGVLDAESLTAIDAATVAEVERCAALLSARLEEVGALGPASPAQRLARISARLASSEDPEGVVREALAGAIELSGYESAVVALADGHGALYPHLAEGPFAVAFSQLEPHELAAMAVWVDEGTSSYTVGDTAGRGFAGHEVLRRAGVGSLIVLPLVAAGERVGLIVVADRAARRPAFEDIELLELLALQTANGLRMASVLSQLRVSARPADRPARVAADRRARRGPARRHRRPRRDQRRPRPGRGRRRPARHRRAAARADARGRPGVPDRRRRVRGDVGRAPRAGRRVDRVGTALAGAGSARAARCPWGCCGRAGWRVRRGAGLAGR